MVSGWTWQVNAYVPAPLNVAVKVPPELTWGWSAKASAPVLTTLWAPWTQTKVALPPAAISTCSGTKKNFWKPTISMVAAVGKDGCVVGAGSGGAVATTGVPVAVAVGSMVFAGVGVAGTVGLG